MNYNKISKAAYFFSSTIIKQVFRNPYCRYNKTFYYNKSSQNVPETQDYRFKMFPANLNMRQSQIQHINIIIDDFFKRISPTKTTANDKYFFQERNQYFDKRLLQYIEQFKQNLKRQEVNLSIKRIQNQEIENVGFLKIFGIDYPTQQYIHELSFEKKGQILECKKQEIQKKKTPQQLAQQQLKQRFTGAKKKQQKRKQLQNIMKPTASKITQKLKKNTKGVLDFFFKKQQQASKFQKFVQYFNFGQGNHIRTQKILIPIHYTLTKKGHQTQEGNIKVQTNWLYKMIQKQAGSIKLNKKRVIYNFQGWARDSFIPILRFDDIPQ